MKQNKAAWASIAAVIVLMTAAYWWFTSTQYVDALVGVSTVNTEIPGTAKMEDGVSGTAKQTDSPVVHPLGDSAGPIVDARSMTVAQVVANLDATRFASLFSSVGGNAMVSGSDQFTVFVPTNGAMRGFPSGMTTAQMKRFVEYHIVRGRALDTDAMIAGSVQTLSGDALNLNFGVNDIPLVGSGIVITQFNCKNGVVYTINSVLLPPQK
jgi:hypothetical protein